MRPGVKEVAKSTPGAKVAYAGHRAGQAVGSGISRGFTGGAVFLGHAVNKGYYGTQTAIRNVNKHSLAMHRRMTPGLQYANRKAKAARARIRSGVRSGRRRVQRYRDNRAKRKQKKKEKKARQRAAVRDKMLKGVGHHDTYHRVANFDYNTNPFTIPAVQRGFAPEQYPALRAGGMDMGPEYNRTQPKPNPMVYYQ